MKILCFRTSPQPCYDQTSHKRLPEQRDVADPKEEEEETSSLEHRAAMDLEEEEQVSLPLEGEDTDQREEEEEITPPEEGWMCETTDGKEALSFKPKEQAESVESLEEEPISVFPPPNTFPPPDATLPPSVFPPPTAFTFNSVFPPPTGHTPNSVFPPPNEFPLQESSPFDIYFLQFSLFLKLTLTCSLVLWLLSGI